MPKTTATSPQHPVDVRGQYEELPYPPRNPADEKTRLLQGNLDCLDLLNFYCFGGAREFNKNFRVLVAGGGTGDATVHLAEQLKGSQAELVYLDFSTASMKVARQRAKVRGLTNIEWVNESLLELPNLGLGKFDFIHSSGVLHHLASPAEGLAALEGVLAPSGALGLMVYALYGRTGIYQMQELLRRLTANSPSRAEKITIAREVLENLPPTNWFARDGNRWQDINDYGDAGLVDLLLHEQDVAYSVPQLYDWLSTANMTPTGFVSPCGPAGYLPETYVTDEDLLAVINSHPLPRRQAIAELLHGRIHAHDFFAMRQNEAATPPEPAAHLVPFVFNDPTGGAGLAALMAHMETHPGRPVGLAHGGLKVPFTPDRFTAPLLKAVDGQTTWGEIVTQVAAQTGAPPEEVDTSFHALFARARLVHWLLLKTAQK